MTRYTNNYFTKAGGEEWLVAINSKTPAENDEVEITRKDGKSTIVQVANVLRQLECGAWLCDFWALPTTPLPPHENPYDEFGLGNQNDICREGVFNGFEYVAR